MAEMEGIPGGSVPYDTHPARKGHCLVCKKRTPGLCAWCSDPDAFFCSLDCNLAKKDGQDATKHSNPLCYVDFNASDLASDFASASAKNRKSAKNKSARNKSDRNKSAKNSSANSSANKLKDLVRGHDSPTDFEVCTEWGFNCCDENEEQKLLDVYRFMLVTCAVSPWQMNQWRLDKTLWDKIREAFEDSDFLPNYGPRKWFLENKEVFE